MSNGFRLFRSRSTGKTGYYPDFYATWPDFEEITSEEDPCIDCVVQSDGPEFLDEEDNELMDED